MGKTMDYFTEEWIYDLLNKAFHRFYNSSDRELLGYKGIEWAVAFRLGIIVDGIIKEQDINYNVDAEFNKSGEGVKPIFSECGVSCNDCKLSKNSNTDKKVRPDLIVHKRGEQDNLLCIEIKTHNEDTQTDKEKLQYMTCPNGKYRYLFGASLQIHDTYTNVTIFQNGKVTSNYLLPDYVNT